MPAPDRAAGTIMLIYGYVPSRITRIKNKGKSKKPKVTDVILSRDNRHFLTKQPYSVPGNTDVDYRSSIVGGDRRL